MKNISKDSFLSIPIPFPTPAEQRAIAEALSDVDGLLGALEALIAKKRAIKQAAMQQLLTGKTRLPGFSGEWETKCVADMGDVITGGTPSTGVNEYWGGEIPWVTPTDITSSRDIDATERMITPSGLDAIRGLPKDSVLVTCIASIGKNAILRTMGGCNQQINAVIPNKACSSEFLYYLFEHSKSYLLANAGITATNIVSKKDFSGLTFRLPLRKEQTAIATVLSDMDAEIASLEARRNKTRATKQGMMQQLLTGRVRLVKPGLAK
jgi:type I restriction enzyme S subunit